MTTKLPVRHQGLEDVQLQLVIFRGAVTGIAVEARMDAPGAGSAQRAFQGVSVPPRIGRPPGIHRRRALTLSRIFDVSLASLFESPMAETPCVIVRAGEAVERRVHGLKYAPLSQRGRFFNVQPIASEGVSFAPRQRALSSRWRGMDLCFVRQTHIVARGQNL